MNKYVYVVERYDYDNSELTYGTEFITYHYANAYDYIREQISSTNLTYEGEDLHIDSFINSSIFTNKYVYVIEKFLVK